MQQQEKIWSHLLKQVAVVSKVASMLLAGHLCLCLLQPVGVEHERRGAGGCGENIGAWACAHAQMGIKHGAGCNMLLSAVI